MDETPDRFAYRCLPLLIANQAGWLVLNECELRVTWDGTERIDGVQITALDGGVPSARAHFGCGIVTWSLPYLFKTSRGYNLLVRGPANWPKDGAWPLEGVVETDWTAATFTVNWKLTQPDRAVEFGRGEPICLLVPQRRGELEGLRPEVRPLESAPDLADAHAHWSQSREQFFEQMQIPSSEAARRGWQRHYLHGVSSDGAPAPEHQTKLRLKPFGTPSDDR